MSTFTNSISMVFKGAIKSFQTFPIALACALAFVIVTFIRIQLDWPAQEAYNFLINCLHFSFALGAIFGLSAITAAHSHFNTKKAFVLANLTGLVAVIITFLLLYNFGGIETSYSSYLVLSDIATARVAAVIFISLLTFIILAATPQKQSNFASSFFMTHKSLLIGLLYGGVIMLGLMAIAGAVQALIYNELSEKVYMYISTIGGFLIFTIFVGYFPDFRKGQIDEHRRKAEKQPRFIEILFANILVPIFLALTLVLLIWAGRTIFGGMQSSFGELAAIAAAYTIGGIWLHIMLTNHSSAMADFYKRIYPIAALVILAFEAWALIIQLNNSGIKTTEYLFFLLWLMAGAAAVLLIIKKTKAHIPIIIITCALAVIAILPGIGYNSLPVKMQVDRLENILIEQEILVDGTLIPAEIEPDEEKRIQITQSVIYLDRLEDAKLPQWFVEDLSHNNIFEENFGFSPTWPTPDRPDEFVWSSFFLSDQVIELDEYQWAVNLSMNINNEAEGVTIEGEHGTYNIYWQMHNNENDLPQLNILLNEEVIIEADFTSYIEQIEERYPVGQDMPYQGSLEDMSIQLESDEIKALLVINNINIDGRGYEEMPRYWIEPDALYIQELP